MIKDEILWQALNAMENEKIIAESDKSENREEDVFNRIPNQIEWKSIIRAILFSNEIAKEALELKEEIINLSPPQIHILLNSLIDKCNEYLEDENRLRKIVSEVPEECQNILLKFINSNDVEINGTLENRLNLLKIAKKKEKYKELQIKLKSETSDEEKMKIFADLMRIKNEIQEIKSKL